MRELAVAIERAQAAVLTSDADLLEKQTASQKSLCQLMAGLCAWPGPADELTWRELRQTAKRAVQNNRVLAALLRRAKRSLKIVALAQASRANTYVPSTISRASAMDSKQRCHV